MANDNKMVIGCDPHSNGSKGESAVAFVTLGEVVAQYMGRPEKDYFEMVKNEQIFFNPVMGADGFPKRFDITVTEDAEFEIIEPKRIEDK